jgi:DNA-directed RNA polymerase subunit RPC12/RpoP
MAQEALYVCTTCGKDFYAKEGKGLLFDEYRCVKCDSIKRVATMHKYLPAQLYRSPTADDIGVCQVCGGALRNDIKPMCPCCKGRDINQKAVLCLYV